MQQSPLLQPGPFGTRVAPQESVATSQASQRTWPKPSEAKVGDLFYRYHNTLTSSGVDEFDEPVGPGFESVWFSTYEVCSVTPKGARIMGWFGPDDGIAAKGSRPVMDHYTNKFAYPSKGEALLGFIARKKREQAIMSRRYFRSREAESKAEKLLMQELQNA